MDQHRLQIEDGIQKVTKAAQGLSVASDLQELLHLIQRPGWTTPAEALFTQGILESLLAHLTVASELSRALLAAGRAVGTK